MWFIKYIYLLRLVNIEKDKNILLFNKKSDFRMEYCTLEELEHQLTKNRKAESKLVFLAWFQVVSRVVEIGFWLKNLKKK